MGIAAKILLPVLAMIVSVSAFAADVGTLRVARPSVVAVAPGVAAAPGQTVVIEQASPIMPAPVVRYGCSRVWRCDSLICEWRRGCWGIYGYMEGPYYTLALAKRQWERHGWPMPAERRTRVSVSK
jgi:hypothetical protein